MLEKLINLIDRYSYIDLSSEIFYRINLKVKKILYKHLYKFDNVDFGKYAKIIGVKHIKIGSNFNVARFLWLEAVSEYNGVKYQPVIAIGNNVHLSEHVQITAINAITIGDHVAIGSNTFLSDHGHGNYGLVNHDAPEIPPIKRALKSYGIITISDNVFIGNNVVILGNVQIGYGAVIGANTILKNGMVIAPETMVVGNPAKVIKVYNHRLKQWVKND